MDSRTGWIIVGMVFITLGLLVLHAPLTNPIVWLIMGGLAVTNGLLMGYLSRRAH